MKDEQDARLLAIRNDPVVGKTQPSVMSECYEDAEIVAALNKEGVLTPTAAIKWARDIDGLHWEQGLNQRFGDDDDPQLKAYREFKDLCKKHPIPE